MRKLLSLIVISLFVMSGLVFATSTYTYENVTILGGYMGPKGQTPPVEAIRVTVGSDDDSIAIGDVMCWMIEPQITDGNALGLAVNKCRRNVSEDVSTSAGYGPYAGVMITTALSSDSGLSLWANATPTRPTESMGFMAIRGYCDAKIDVSHSSVGEMLVIVGGNAGLEGYFATEPFADTMGISSDVGYLLETPGSTNGLLKVWLR